MTEQRFRFPTTPFLQTLSTRKRCGLNNNARLLVLLSVTAIYAATFPAMYSAVQGVATIGSLVLVSIAGSFFGLLPGLGASVVIIGLNLGLHHAVGLPVTYYDVHTITTTSLLLLLGTLTGWLGDLLEREKMHIRTLEAERKQLMDEILKRETIERTLQQAYVDLEHRVQERTEGLSAANARLQESERRYRDVVEQATEIIYTTDVAGRFTFANKAAMETTGYTMEAASELRSIDLVHPEFVPLVKTTYARQFLVRRPTTYLEFPFHTKSGETKWVAQNASLIVENDEPVGFHFVARDVTREKLDEEQIAQQAALLDLAHDAILVTDLDDSITYWNKGAERVYGWTEAEAKQKLSSELLVTDQTTKFEEALRIVQAKGEWRGELFQVTKEGKELIVESRWTLVRHRNGAPHAIMFINTDISEKKRLEAQFLRAQRVESLGTLAGGIAHDLNNVLTPIVMAIELLKSRVNDEKAGKLLHTIEASSLRGRDIVKQVLTFARGFKSDRVPVQLKHLLSDIERIIHDTFPKSIYLVTDVSKDLWDVMGDSTQLHQVIINLCVNARDAMPNGGTLSILMENILLDEHYARKYYEANSGPYVVVSVTDTGTGIRPELVDKIFEPFFTTKEVGKGTGLGLSTVASIVKNHGGFVNVYSALGKGTKFKVYIPASRDRVADERQAGNSTGCFTGNGEVILVVDDEPAILEIARAILEEHRYEVLTANDGAEATAVYAEHKDKVKLVITDVMMPYMDGPATVRALRRMNPAVRVIAASGLVANVKATEIDSLEAEAFLLKPFTAEMLLRTVAKAMKAVPKS